ncbi:MAG: transposase [Candidatus Dadabacteria bacterium]|nr:transposase [Candidatus Dadabacteria bacterium]MYE60732.1 transposase [Candidatus Dadabacteria bacterium]MYI73188.1 transposase [Candidatus Dadabacteria bacterium]
MPKRFQVSRFGEWCKKPYPKAPQFTRIRTTGTKGSRKRTAGTRRKPLSRRIHKRTESHHTQGIESFWFMLKRGLAGVYRKMSKKRLQCYIDEYAGRHNIRPLASIEQIDAVIEAMNGKRLKYKDLIQWKGRHGGTYSAGTCGKPAPIL